MVSKIFNSRPETPATITSKLTTRRTTIKRSSTAPQFYFVNEIVNDERKSSSKKKMMKNKKIHYYLNYNKCKYPANFGIIWERVPYDKDFSNRVTSISKLLILILSILLILLF